MAFYVPPVCVRLVIELVRLMISQLSQKSDNSESSDRKGRTDLRPESFLDLNLRLNLVYASDCLKSMRIPFSRRLVCSIYFAGILITSGCIRSGLRARPSVAVSIARDANRNQPVAVD